MEKVAQDWKKAFPSESFGAHLFDEFAQRAKNAAAEVFRVKTAAEAKNVIADIARSINAKKIVAVNWPDQQTVGIFDCLKSQGMELYTDCADIRHHAETADLGISAVEFGVAETGSVCQDAFAIESRLVSTLPPVHLVVLNSNYITADMKSAFDIIAKVFDRGYLSFITGPSRTADIERVLTIGVHGPTRFIIVAVDETVNGGDA